MIIYCIIFLEYISPKNCKIELLNEDVFFLITLLALGGMILDDLASPGEK